MDQALHPAPPLYWSVTHLQVVTQALAFSQLKGMTTEENFFSRTIRWAKNGFLFGFALGIFPLLFLFLLVYLLFRVIYGFVTGVFTLGWSIFLRVIFPPLLIYDTWRLMTGRKE